MVIISSKWNTATSSWKAKEGGGQEKLNPNLSLEAGGFRAASAPSLHIFGNGMNMSGQHADAGSDSRGKAAHNSDCLLN